MTKAQMAEREESRSKLLEWLKPGMTINLILRHVSRSGMQRTIVPMLLDDDGPSYLGYHVGRLLGARTDRDHGVKVTGYGMDMGFHLVYELGACLWPEGYECTGKGCRSNDHFNSGPKRDDYSPSHHHRDGGYALRHRWL